MSPGAGSGLLVMAGGWPAWPTRREPVMSPQPQIQNRAAQEYAAIPVRVTMDALPAAVDEGFPELFRWLGEHAVTPAGPPFIRYLVIDMAGGLQIELAGPVGNHVGGGRGGPGRPLPPPPA